MGLVFGHNLGKKFEMHYTTQYIKKMLPYFPLEVRRAFETYDYRYLYLFNNPGAKSRILFDPITGLALS